jgi:GTP-binding protein
VPIAFTTAKTGRNAYTVLNLAQNLHKQAGRRISTPELNRVLRRSLEQQPPPMRLNRRPKITFATQVATQPPTIVLITNGPELFAPTYQRYLLKTFRDHLPFTDVPIKLYLRHKHRGDDVANGEKEPSPKEELSKQRSRGPKPKKEKKPVRDRQTPELWKDL